MKYSQVYNAVVLTPKAANKKSETAPDAAAEASGVPQKKAFSKLGKVHHAVFSPKGTKVVGFLIKRPDLVGMIKRDDVFVALDSCKLVDGALHVSKDDESFDDAARKRLGIDWDACIMWAGMDAETTDGHRVGYVNDVEFDERTGEVALFLVGDGGVSRQLVGSFEIPASMLVGYSKGRMLVDPAAKDLSLNGGLAARAGEATAKAKMGAEQASEKITQGTVEAIDKGSHDFGRMISETKRAYQKQAGTSPKKAGAAKASGSSGKKAQPSAKKAPTSDEAARAVGKQIGKLGSMFGSFAEEYKKSSK